HEGVADGRADEGEAPLAQRLRHGLALLRLGRDLPQRPPGIELRLSAHELPEEWREAALLLLDLQEAAGVRDGPLDLGPVAHDPRVLHQLLDAARAPPGDLARIESLEGAAEGLPLAQDDEPREPGLEPVEHQLLEQRPGIALGEAPLLVVVADVQGVARRPWAARHARMVARREAC